MSCKHNYLFLVSDYMAEYAMEELENLDWVKKINKSYLSKNKLKDFIYSTYLSVSANRLISLPLKFLVYKSLLKVSFKENKPVCIIIYPPWYDKQLIKYLRKNFPNCKLIICFHDTVKQALNSNRHLTIDIIKNHFDAAIVYNPDDAEKYGFLLHPVGYSAVPVEKLEVLPHSDVVFIGAAKGRLPIIRKIYRQFTNAGLKCDFYVTEVPKKERENDGIIYADRAMPFNEYLAREVASDCLLEILQKDSVGRTYRMIEAIIYNKKLITNCPEIKNTPYYNEDYVLYFENADEINAEFVKKSNCRIDYNYRGDFSHLAFIEFIDDYFKGKQD